MNLTRYNPSFWRFLPLATIAVVSQIAYDSIKRQLHSRLQRERSQKFKLYQQARHFNAQIRAMRSNISSIFGSKRIPYSTEILRTGSEYHGEPGFIAGTLTDHFKQWFSSTYLLKLCKHSQ